MLFIAPALWSNFGTDNDVVVGCEVDASQSSMPLPDDCPKAVLTRAQ